MQTGVVRYLLDTNTVSDAVKGRADVLARLELAPVGCVAISSVTLGEIRYGLAWKHRPTGLTRIVEEFLRRVDVLQWGDREANHYGTLRAECRRKGITIGALDLLIASQAHAAGAVLVTGDKTLRSIPGLKTENWRAS